MKESDTLALDTVIRMSTAASLPALRAALTGTEGGR
jgi:hypothetical protein